MPGPPIAVGPLDTPATDAIPGWADEAVERGPSVPPWAAEAIERGGGRPVPPDQTADALVWLSPRHVVELRDALDANPGFRWVQLPWAGVEAVAAEGMLTAERTWTCAKGSYAEPVAEHAMALALAGLRRLPERVRATSWGEPSGTSLYGQDVTIVGGGGIAAALLRLLAPYRVRATVVRRRTERVDGTARTLPASQLHDALRGALVVFLALALTPETTGIIGAAELERMGERAWLINVARGRHVDTDALVAALRAGSIAGAGLDVTEPEPLTDGHPLWTLPNCILTPHTANTWEMVQPLLAARIAANVAHFVAGEPLEGLVDPAAGY